MKQLLQRSLAVVLLGVGIIVTLRGALSADESPRPSILSNEALGQKRSGLFAKMEVGQFAYIREAHGKLTITYADVELPVFGPKSQITEVGPDYVVVEEQIGEDIVERRIPQHSVLLAERVRRK